MEINKQLFEILDIEKFHMEQKISINRQAKNFLNNQILDFVSLKDKTTKIVADFYNEIKFPNYDSYESF